MDVIPVIDIRLGVAVRAMCGDRAHYRPIESVLAAGCDPVALALGYCALYPFRTIYVADLDGIEGRGQNADILDRLIAAVPHIEFWIDDGSATVAAAEGILRRPNCALVVGSESLRRLDDLHNLKGAGRLVLSLDFRGPTFVGPAGLQRQPALWPKRVIVMTLGRVGSGEGPDLERLREIVGRAPTNEVFAAGGVRNLADLIAATQCGAAGALVASALHSGMLAAGDLTKVADHSPSHYTS
jgi:phosphoribosylformimino-5-aminoimidazole carboxamide ribotide isomerase